jgi:glucose uptake protein GlcU
MTETLLDIRRIIGGLLGVYGLILLIAGIVGSDADKNKAAGVNINLWAGLVLLVMSALFLVWAFTRPLMEELEEAEQEGPDSPE